MGRGATRTALDGARALVHDRRMGTGASEAGAEAGAGHGACLNCGTALVGPHCHECGQAADVHRTVTAWWHDLAHGVLHLDGKIWRTLPLLAVWPGDLTRRFVDGERARFVSPLALFLFSVFLMFAVFGAVGGRSGIVDRSEMEKGLAAQVTKAEAHVASLERERAAAAAAGRATGPIDTRMKTAREELAIVRTMNEKGVVQGGVARIVDDLPPRIRAPIEKAAANPSLFFYKVQTNAYKFSWALVPLSVPFVWMLFLHRRRYREQYKAYDHLVFVTYSIAFMSMALIAFVLLRAAGITGGFLSFLFLLAPPVHMYRQLRGAYRLSRGSAAWRTAALLVSAASAIVLFLGILVAVGILG